MLLFVITMLTEMRNQKQLLHFYAASDFEQKPHVASKLSKEAFWVFFEEKKNSEAKAASNFKKKLSTYHTVLLEFFSNIMNN